MTTHPSGAVAFGDAALERREMNFQPTYPPV